MSALCDRDPPVKFTVRMHHLSHRLAIETVNEPQAVGPVVLLEYKDLEKLSPRQRRLLANLHHRSRSRVSVHGMPHVTVRSVHST